MPREGVQVRAYVLKVTDRAALLDVDNDEQWVPLSCIEEDVEVDEDDRVYLTIAAWKAAELEWE